MLKLLQDMDVNSKRVILRCDFNVPIKNNQIIDDYKIVKSLDTINYLLEHNSKIIILSHLGRIKTEADKINNSLELVAIRLKELLNKSVIFSKVLKDDALTNKVMTLNDKDILLLENTRFLDVLDGSESNCSDELSKYWASLGEVFVFDAFGTSHRRHASTYGISKYLPTCIGFLVQKEMDMLNKNVINANKPFTIIMGGAKIDDKLDLINKLLPKCDHLLLCGGLANTCLKVLGFKIGNSLSTNNIDVINKVKQILVDYKEKIALPTDLIVTNSYNDSFIDQKNFNEIDSNEEIKDIGRNSLEIFKNIINTSKTVFINGTCGVYEDNRFANGTKELFSILSNSPATVIVGGGDALSAARLFNYSDKFEFVSTGGGATLEYIINEKINALEDEIEIL